MYKGIFEIFSRYWQTYGGTRELVRSPYLHLSVVLTILTCHFWYTDKWWDQVLSVLPNLLGFSLGGLAMFLSFGDDRFRRFLADGANDDGEPSSYMVVCASFVHFIVFQLVALMIAFLAKSLWFCFDWPSSMQGFVVVCTAAFNCVGYLLFLYSVASMLAATMAVFRICSWYQLHQRATKESNESGIDP